MPRPEIIAHRGLPQRFRENTLASFDAAMGLGADGVELDVHRTADGVVVVHHDADVVTAVGRFVIAECTLSQIRAAAADVATLDEVLDLVGLRGIVYVEIKAPRIAREVVEVVRRHPSTRCAIHSFHHPTIRDVHELDPRLETGVGLVAYPVRPGVVMSDASATDYWISHELIDLELVRAVHAAGGRVMAWTVNGIARARELADLGVDALCTDVADQFVPALTSARH